MGKNAGTRGFPGHVDRGAEPFVFLLSEPEEQERSGGEDQQTGYQQREEKIKVCREKNRQKKGETRQRKRTFHRRTAFP